MTWPKLAAGTAPSGRRRSRTLCTVVPSVRRPSWMRRCTASAITNLLTLAWRKNVVGSTGLKRGLGGVSPRVNESNLPYQCERGAADAVTAHRLPHDLVDRGDGGWPCWREPAWPHPVGSPGEEGRKTSP